MKLFVLSFTMEAANLFRSKDDQDYCEYAVVLAPDEMTARKLASAEDNGGAKERMYIDVDPWLESKYVECYECPLNEERIVFSKFSDCIPNC